MTNNRSDEYFRPPSNELADIRSRLEAVALSFGVGYEFEWDRRMMSLTVNDPNGNPVATMHVEAVT